MFTVVQQHLAIDHHIIDPNSTLLDVHLTTRERIHGLARLGANGVGVEDRDVSGLPGGEEAPVIQVVVGSKNWKAQKYMYLGEPALRMV